jgi:TP901 family phage tail tape measure protein
MADVQSNIQVSIDTTQALASIKNLQRQISAFHSSMAKGGAAANAVSAQMQQTLLNSINAGGKFSAQIRTIKTTTESFTDSLEKGKFSVGEYFRYAGGASKTFGRLFKTEFDTINKVARENVKDLQTQYIRLGRDASGAMKSIAVRPLSLDMTDLGTRTQLAAQKQALMNQLLRQGSTQLLNFGKNTQWAGRQLMVGFTIPLMAVGSAAAKTFMDMESQVIKFRKVYGDLFTPEEESKKALKDIQDLGREFTKYGVAVSSTVGVAAEAAAAGFAGIDLQRQTEQSIRLSILGQVDYQKALETTISVQNAFGISSDELATSIDFLNAVENQTVLSLDDVTTAIPKSAPIIQQLGGDIKDLAFFMTAMKEGGINASEGANALKSGLASMINPTGKAVAMLESFGINVRKIVVDNKGDLKKTVIEFATALNQLDPLNRAQAIEQMFGKFQFARLSTLFANVTKEGTQASRVLDLAGASVQELATLSEKELGMTSESAMNKFKGAVESLKLSLIPLGEEFLKAVTPVAEFVTKILDKFNGLSSTTKKIIVTLTAIIGGLGPVFLMTFGLLANGLANIIKGFTVIKSLFNKTGQETGTLGTATKYMTAEQRNAAAVAASLDQVHTKLRQTFTSEAAAVNLLTQAYQRAIAAQATFMPVAAPMGRGPVPTKRAKGKPAIVGGTGNKDSELALLMPGETVIPTKMSQKYGGIINAMIADRVPGYANGLLSFGGQQFPVSPSSLVPVQRLIANIQSLGVVIDNIDDVILQTLERLASGVEGSTKITAKRLESALAPITDLAKSTVAVQGKFEGNAGFVMAHGLPKVTLNPEQITAFEQTETGTTFGSSLQGRDQSIRARTGAPGPVTGLTNMVFPMPAGFNQARMTGAEGAQWIGQNRTRFTSGIAAQAGLDPNDPDLLRFGTAIGKALKSAAHRGVVVTQDDFEKIISQALEKEIFDVGKNTSAAVKTAFADAKKVSTIMYPNISSTGGESRYSREPIPAALRGTTVGGIDLSSSRSYRGISTGNTEAMNVQADNFTMNSIRARVRKFFTRMPKEVEKEIETVLDISSPSGVTQSGRVPGAATRPQGPAPIGAYPLPGMRILPIVPKGPPPPPPPPPMPTRTQLIYAKARGLGGKMTGMGGGMGLLGVNMGLSMLPDFAGKGIMQGGLAGANLGMMFGPYGMAIGATIGIVTSAVSALIGKYKDLQAVTAATFKSSADVATFFGNEVVDTTLKVGSLKNSIRSMSTSLGDAGKSFGYTNEELSRFIALVASLPEGNPLKTIVDGLKKEDSASKIIEIANAFVATQVALGQLKPEQAQKQFDLLLASSDNVAMVGSTFVNFTNQVEATTQMLKNAAENSVALGESLIQLTGAAANSSSLAQLTGIIDGIAAAGVSGAAALTSMYNAYLLIGNTEAATGVKILRNVTGITGEQTAFLIAAAAKGFSKQITSKTTAEELVKEAQTWLEKNQDRIFKKTGGGTDITQTKAYKDQEKESSGIKKNIDLLKKKKKIIDDQIKQQEKISNELKRQNDYLDKQRSLDKEIVDAKIKGDYIGAASLLQQKSENTAEFNAETEKSALQAKSDALQKQIDALQLRNEEIVSAINKSSEKQAAATAAAAGSIVDAIIGGYSFNSGARARRNRSGQPFSNLPGTEAPENTNKIGGPTLSQTMIDPKTGKRVMLPEGYFTGRLSGYTNSRSWKKGDVLFIGKDGDIPAIITDDITNPKESGSIEVTSVDKNSGFFQYRVKAATGGMIRGAGTPTSDSIPALLSNGEYVIKADSVNKYGVGTFDALNTQKFKDGGLASRPKYGTRPEKKQNWFQRYVSNLTEGSKKTPSWARDPLGVHSLLRMFAGKSREGDTFAATMLPLNLMGMGIPGKVGLLGKGTVAATTGARVAAGASKAVKPIFSRMTPSLGATGSAALAGRLPEQAALHAAGELVDPIYAGKVVQDTIHSGILAAAKARGARVPDTGTIYAADEFADESVNLMTAGLLVKSDLGVSLRSMWGAAYDEMVKMGSKSIEGITKRDFFLKLHRSSPGVMTRYDDEVASQFVKESNLALLQSLGLRSDQAIAMYRSDPAPSGKSVPGYYSLSERFAHEYGRQYTAAGGMRTFDPRTGGLFKVDLDPADFPSPIGMGGVADEYSTVLGEKATLGAKRVASAKLTGAWVRGFPFDEYYEGLTIKNFSSVRAKINESVPSLLEKYPLLTQRHVQNILKKDEVLDEATLDFSRLQLVYDNALNYRTIGPDRQEPLDQLIKLLEDLGEIAGQPLIAPRFAKGGLIKGPGTGISDSITAGFGYAGGGSIRVSNGEYVVKASSVRDYGVDAMNAVNNGTATIGTNSGGTVYNINMPITSNNANPEGVANEVMRRLKLEVSKNNKSNKVGL